MAGIVNETRPVKARKDHQCSSCRGQIVQGSTYEMTVFKDGGRIYSWRQCVWCNNLIATNEQAREEWWDRCCDQEFFEGDMRNIAQEMGLDPPPIFKGHLP